MSVAPPLWAPSAWVDGRWHDAVRLRVGADGRWAAVERGVAAAPGDEVLAGAALPGLVDAHSHAFQRAFAGLAETRDGPDDDFWSWRDRMYRVAQRVKPAQLRAVAAQLYAELLRGGYTQVCEFHYLHDDAGRGDGLPPLHEALLAAAADAGIGLTLLPVLYQRAGFAQAALRDDQRRFASDAARVRAWHAAAAARAGATLNAGVAIHSLRAATPEAMRHLVEGLGDVPIHIHVAEQQAEVADCLRATGARPLEWLLRELPVDARWQLVHATHATAAEIDAVARAGAGVVICPSTEANLGDGLTDVPRWLAAGVPLAIGSDSHVTRDAREELRWLDYGQRLALQRRNVLAAPEAGQPSTAARLFGRALAGGAAAAGQRAWGLQPGARADLLLLDAQDPALAGVPPSRRLDAAVFSSPARPFADVMVAGRWAVRGGRADGDARRLADFSRAMDELWRT